MPTPPATSPPQALSPDRSPLRLLVGYGLGDAGTGLAATQLGFYLFVFFTCTAGLPAVIAGSLLMVIRVWDGLNDPLIGWLSDHTRTRWGPRLPWMLAAAVPLGMTLAAMWWVPPGGVASKTAYYVVMAILLMTAYTSVNLPYAALATELTDDTATRTRLNVARFTGSILAGLSGLVVAAQLVNRGPDGFLQMGVITGTIATTATLVCCGLMAPYAKKASHPTGKREPVGQQLRRIVANRRFIKVLGLYLLLWCALQLMQPVALIYLVQLMRVPPAAASWILLPFQISALIGLQVWSRVAYSQGRVAALRWGAGLWILACGVSLVLPPLGPQGLLEGSNLVRFTLLVGTIITVGLGASTAYLIPWSLLPDAIDHDPEKPAGLYTAWMVLIQKIGIGLSIQVLGLLLWVSGYQSSGSCGQGPVALEQPATALLTIRVCMGLIPALLIIGGLLVMRRWPDKGSHLLHRHA